MSLIDMSLLNRALYKAGCAHRLSEYLQRREITDDIGDVHQLVLVDKKHLAKLSSQLKALMANDMRVCLHPLGGLALYSLCDWEERISPQVEALPGLDPTSRYIRRRMLGFMTPMPATNDIFEFPEVMISATKLTGNDIIIDFEDGSAEIWADEVLDLRLKNRPVQP